MPHSIFFSPNLFSISCNVILSTTHFIYHWKIPYISKSPGMQSMASTLSVCFLALIQLHLPLFNFALRYSCESSKITAVRPVLPWELQHKSQEKLYLIHIPEPIFVIMEGKNFHSHSLNHTPTLILVEGKIPIPTQRYSFWSSTQRMKNLLFIVTSIFQVVVVIFYCICFLDKGQHLKIV